LFLSSILIFWWGSSKSSINYLFLTMKSAIHKLSATIIMVIKLTFWFNIYCFQHSKCRVCIEEIVISFLKHQTLLIKLLLERRALLRNFATYFFWWFDLKERKEILFSKIKCVFFLAPTIENWLDYFILFTGFWQ